LLGRHVEQRGRRGGSNGITGASVELVQRTPLVRRRERKSLRRPLGLDRADAYSIAGHRRKEGQRRQARTSERIRRRAVHRRHLGLTKRKAAREHERSIYL